MYMQRTKRKVLKLESEKKRSSEMPSRTFEQSGGPQDVLMAEQFRKLRNVLATLGLSRTLRSLLITSCTPGEGKTTVAINLSAAIAKGRDNSVILVDADLRKRTLSSRLDVRNALGLSDVLNEQADVKDCLISTGIRGLTILPAGFKCPDPAELIASNTMRSFCERIKEEYKDSYVIFDSTPVASTSEPNSLSQMVDGVVFVILAEKTRRDIVRKEIKAFNSKKTLGVVLNCAEFETSGYYKKYYGTDPRQPRSILRRFF